jgi:alkanesulfonate monooxygenase SsuD/methylene tetrahydromethanopterin reductase-like flavin-dependent oxidoreductase (luciferase family)
MDGLWTAQEKALVDARLGGSIIGSGATVKKNLARILNQTKADELMINAMIYDHASRLRSYEIVARVWQEKTSTHSI